MLDVSQQVRVGTQTNVLPQLVARAFLLELSQDSVEERIREELEQNPTLELLEPTAAPRFAGPAAGVSAGIDTFGSLPAPMPLGDDLLWQVRATCEDELLTLAEYIIQNLDERGYLAVPLYAMADDLSVSEAEMQEALDAVHALEPAGIGARGLTECLKLQILRMRPAEHPAGLLEFVEGEFAHLVQDANPRGLKAAKSPGAHVYLKFIQEHMYPYPADLYRTPYPMVSDELPRQMPDVVVERDQGSLKISVPMSQRLSLRVDAEYERLARSIRSTGNRQDAHEIAQLVAQAKEFISNLTHRHKVIGKVAMAILKEQEDFIEFGPKALKPYTKKQLAQKLAMHESTVCRATRGKTMMLPDGEVVPFDVFFEDALPAKVTLAKLVREEDPARPFTDGQLAGMLAESGYDVARRTVSKYRGALSIPSATERRRTA